MSYWFECFPQLDLEKHCFISPRLEELSSSCETGEEARLPSGSGGMAGRVWPAQSSSDARVPKQDPAEPGKAEPFLQWFPLTISFCPREV